MNTPNPVPSPRPADFAPRPVPPQIVRPQPTAWESVPGFIRFMIWVLTIIGFIYLIVLPVLMIVVLVGGGLAAAAS